MAPRHVPARITSARRLARRSGNLRRWPLAVALAVVMTATVGAAAAADPPNQGSTIATASLAPASASAPQIANTTEVLLLTGDRISHTAYPDGTTTVEVDPAPRADGESALFQTVESPDGHYVVPVDASELLADGVLDYELFNVTALVDDGLASADELPVIVAGGPAGQGVDTFAATATHTATLSSIDAVGLRLDRASAGALWGELTDPAADLAAASATGDAGDTRIWLDRKVEVSLADSVPQIGAGQVWDAGFDGTGVTVAVLDTGIDPDHPDVADRVVGSANFTADPLADGHGHGTHVAAIVAGSGAASEGVHRGVAPGADLLVGKVLPDSGTGPTSAVIEGMEWAAHAGADIVNMSLGGPTSDGTDPASMAVERLTAETGALFVVASGNNEGDASINSPGAADSALTVGAVNNQDQLASFSNRGPRRGDAGVKPELTAPGDAIVAARAQGTDMGTPVDEYHTSAGGTSMAAPHVAGAAALLAHAHPDWTWDQLKDALASTAKPVDYSVFEGGAGRVDVPAALGGVYAPASVNVGAFLAPYDEQRSEQLTYRNNTDTDVTLELALSGTSWDGQGLPAGAVALADDEITVPAGGTAQVSLTVDAAPGEVGAYAGMVSATDGQTQLRTPFSYYKSTGSNELTVHNLNFRGEPESGTAIRAIKLDSPLPNNPFHEMETWEWSDDDGTVRLFVADGLYDIYGAETSYRDPHSDRITNMVETEVEISSDTTVTLEASKGVKVGPDTLDQLDLKSATASYNRGFETGEFSTGFLINYDPVRFYMQPAQHTTGWMEVREMWTLAEPLVTKAQVVSDRRTVSLTPEYHNYFAGPGIAGEHDLELVDAGTGSPQELARAQVQGRAALIGIPVPHEEANPYTQVFLAAGAATDEAVAQGAAAVVIYIDEPGAQPIFGLRSEGIVQFSVSWQEAVRARSQLVGARDPGRLQLHAHADPTDLYHLRYVQEPELTDPRHQVDDADLVTVESRYHADEPDFTQNMVAIGFLPGQATGSGLQYTARAPLQVREHILAGDHLRWHRMVSQRGSTGFRADADLTSREAFLPGQQPEAEVWFQSPMRTGAADLPSETQWTDLMCAFCRHGDDFRPGVWYLDSDPRHYHRSFLDEGTSYRLFIGDQEIPNTGSSFLPSFEMAPESATYRLEMTGIQQGVPGARTLAPRIETEWIFDSQRPDEDAVPQGYTCELAGGTGCEFAHLLQLDYQLDLDLYNSAPAGASHTFEVNATPHSQVDTPRPPAVSRFDVAYSTDDGQTWRPARVRPDRDRTGFEVTVTHPELTDTDGYVWLRAQARDTSGNEISQTIERAYALR